MGERKLGRLVYRERDEEIFPRVIAQLSAEALQANYHAIGQLVPHQAILPMIKANAYGHGAYWAARTLMNFPGLYGFGVATLEEGREVREEIGYRGRTRILVFSGTTPWSEEKGQFCEKYGLTAVISRDEDWQSFLRGGWTERVSYELKFNTGMNRLGLSTSMAPAVARALRNRPPHEHPTGILSHLAIADNPEARLSVQQRERFVAIKGELAAAAPSAHFHLASSAGIWKHQLWGLKGLTDVVRPGLALYGITPWDGAPERGISPVMTVKAVVVATHRLKRGESTGYGGTFTVSGNETIPVAVVAAGYADGVHRTLSNEGHAWVSGRASRFVGRVSMDMATVRCTEKTRPGEWVELLGPHVDIWAQAQAAGTIPYELLTSISPRVQRIYERRQQR